MDRLYGGIIGWVVGIVITFLIGFNYFPNASELADMVAVMFGGLFCGAIGYFIAAQYDEG